MNLLKNLARDALGSSSSSSKSLEDWYITAERAEGIKDTDRFSKSDPYLKIDFGGKSVKTRTIKNDRSPAWNETFHFQLSPDKLGDIHIKLMDDDIGLDDSIGTATVSRGDFPLTSGEDKVIKVPVLRKGQMSGLVYLRIKRTGGNFSSSSQSYGISSNQQFGQQQQYPQSNFSQQPMSSSYNQSSYQSQYPGQGPMMNQPQQQMGMTGSQHMGMGGLPQQHMGMGGSQQPQGFYNNPPNSNFDQQRRY